MVVAIMKGYIIFVIILMLLYTARHYNCKTSGQAASLLQ